MFIISKIFLRFKLDCFSPVKLSEDIKIGGRHYKNTSDLLDLYQSKKQSNGQYLIYCIIKDSFSN